MGLNSDTIPIVFGYSSSINTPCQMQMSVQTPYFIIDALFQGINVKITYNIKFTILKSYTSDILRILANN